RRSMVINLPELALKRNSQRAQEENEPLAKQRRNGPEPLQKQASEKKTRCPGDGWEKSADAEHSPAQFFWDKLQAKAEVGDILDRVHEANAPVGQSDQPGAGQQDIQGTEESYR